MPWHRELCNRFEQLLTKYDDHLRLHYWDWRTDPRSTDEDGNSINLFADDFMGNDIGEAGEPLLSAGFYNPYADPYRGDDAHDLAHSNPFDPPRTLERAVGLSPGASTPVPQPYDEVIKGDTFPNMRSSLEGVHNYAHVYIGGTMADQHTSFRDPFVFLLHSNVDTLFATWQLKPGKEWRLDPDLIYGPESNSETTGIFPEAHIGILSPLEPWAGINAPGAEERIL